MLFFFFNDTATTEIYTLSLHDALPISLCFHNPEVQGFWQALTEDYLRSYRSEEHTSELQSQSNLVCRLLLEKKILQITRRRFLNEWEAFKKVISRRNIRMRITIALTLSNLKLLRRITRTKNILHRNVTRRQFAIQNRVASNIGISQSTFSVKAVNLFSRSRRKTNKRKSKHSAMLRNKETRHRMFIGLLNTTRKLA